MPNAVRMYDEQAAFLSLEQLVWPDGPVCPHCLESARLGRLNGVSTPMGRWKCYSCRKPFTARYGTVMHNSHVPAHIWLQSLYLLIASRHRMGSQTLGQIVGVSVRTAWHLKTKIAGALVGEVDRNGTVLPCGIDRVIRYPLGGEAQPGHAGYTARYRRFLAAIEGRAGEETDRQFLEALSRLMRAHHKPDAPTSATDEERQLELGFFPDEAFQMAAENHRGENHRGENHRGHGAPQPKT